jgi:hypothetical protein
MYASVANGQKGAATFIDVTKVAAVNQQDRMNAPSAMITGPGTRAQGQGLRSAYRSRGEPKLAKKLALARTAEAGVVVALAGETPGKRWRSAVAFDINPRP